MDEPFSRRRFLTLSAAGTIAAAGCVEDGGDDGFQPSDGSSDEDDIYWFRPSQEMQDNGAPDRRYAVTELTQPRRIGGFNGEKNEIVAIMDTTNLDVTPQLRDGPE